MLSHGPVARGLDGEALAPAAEARAVELGTAIAYDVLGDLPALRMARPRNTRTACDVGCSFGAVQPIVRREKWSTTTASQKQKGQRLRQGKREPANTICPGQSARQLGPRARHARDSWPSLRVAWPAARRRCRRRPCCLSPCGLGPEQGQAYALYYSACWMIGLTRWGLCESLTEKEEDKVQSVSLTLLRV